MRQFIHCKLFVFSKYHLIKIFWLILIPGDFPAQRPATRSFDVFLDLHPNKRLSKQWWGWWFETPSCPLWRHRNAPFSTGILICPRCSLYENTNLGGFKKAHELLNFHIWIKCISFNVRVRFLCGISKGTFEIPHKILLYAKFCDNPNAKRGDLNKRIYSNLKSDRNFVYGAGARANN